MARPRQFSRREFIKLATLGAFSLVGAPVLRRFPAAAVCPPPPLAHTGLSSGQQLSLIEASQSFIAPEIGAARQVALNIDFVDGPYEGASTMCGPLAIAILKKARLLGAWVDPHDFWLVDPDYSLQPFVDTVPEALYTWERHDTPLKEFDFSRAPLRAGDLMYLFAAPGDTFEHVLVVNRVDSQGRAYSVTNFFVSTGTIIEERMLYDPRQPGVGQFADWSNRQLKNRFGNTGKAGFSIWRVRDGRSLEFPMDKNSLKLRETLDGLLVPAAGKWYGVIRQIGGPLLYQFNPYASFHPASTIKVPIAMAFFQWLQDQKINDWTSYLEERGTGGRSYASLLEAMLVNSEEDATESLEKHLGAAWLDETWRSWGLQVTRVDPRRSSATEIAGLLEDLYSGKRLVSQSNQAILKLMSTNTPNDETRIGVLRPGLPRGSVIYNKRGSLVEWPTVVADSGIVALPNAAYIFTLHGIGKNEAGYEELEQILNRAVGEFGDYLMSS